MVVDDALQLPGSYQWAWDGRDTRGLEVGSGVYYYRISTGLETATGRVVLVE